ncbi:polysaccharide biosynthesis tyrosine autokinase [Vibrio sp. OCN044]|uniref:Polysaccharide biosynthesis tyrosine autokinase n=1 Tax=Vibrio tetraodonis subsp. pristinus TaxID=2695891 RepID=A0A6L8LX78_9VIBR|nr:polysaccharide biosynthesis tyrosine autokinase [Vibrio tetraodonis]MYM60728.1 polysaccharide biosynthesis tyrosine autokinase [Vibrio tetraodonis subsp. pristinus]
MATQQIKQRIESASDEIDLARLFALIIDGKWIIITATMLFAIFGIAFALLSTPIYKADALIQIEQKSSGGISAMVGDMGELFAQESSATTEIEIIKSRMILSDTVDKFNLTTVVVPEYFPLVGKGFSRLMGVQPSIHVAKFEVPSHIQALPHQIVVTAHDKQSYQLVDQDGGVILSGYVGKWAKSDGYKLFVSELDAETGATFKISKRSSLEAIKWLKDNLSISERGKQTGIVELSFVGEDRAKIQSILNDISQNYFLQNVKRNSAEAEKSLAFLKDHLPSVKSDLNSAENKLNTYRQDNESIDLSLEAKSTLEVMVKLEAQLNELTFKESEISQRFTTDHPAYKSLLDKRQVLLEEKQRLNGQVQKLPKTQREILRMTRDVEVNQQIYIQLLNKVQELNIIKAGTVGNVRILDKAQAFDRAVKPKKALIVVLATMLGGMLSVAYVLLKAAFHKGIENPSDIEEIGLSVYASVPKSALQAEFITKQIGRLKKRDSSAKMLLAESNPLDLSIEALRGLRTSLHFAMLEAKNNVLMISGPAPNVGKTFVSTNFAAVVAKAGQKVLLVDADMRKGYLQQPFGLKAEDGLSDYLIGNLEYSSVIKSTDMDNLNIITRGVIPPNPSELLMHQRFTELVEWASDKYDLVIIDTPPVLAVTDPSIVGMHAGTTLMVTRFGVNSIKEIEAARCRFEHAGINVKGVIFNAVEQKASTDYGYYSYAYTNDK